MSNLLWDKIKKLKLNFFDVLNKSFDFPLENLYKMKENKIKGANILNIKGQVDFEFMKIVSCSKK